MKLKVLPKEQLIRGRWYVGRGRNANVALWDGEDFLTIADKGREMVVKRAPFYEKESGCFQPFLLVEEGQMVEPFGTSGWDAHYGYSLEI